MKISILISAYNNKNYTQICIESIEKTAFRSKETICIENGSEETEQCFSNKLTSIQVKRNYGFPFLINLGAAVCKNEWILILNNDCELVTDFFEELEKVVKNNPKGQVFSPKIYQKTAEGKKTIYSCGDFIDKKGLANSFGRGEEDKGQYDSQKTVPLASFACLLVSREVMKRFPLDETYFGYYEDVDFGLRLQKAGIKIYFVPKAICYHVGEASFSKLDKVDNEIRQFRNLSFTVIKHFPWSNIVRHYLIFNLKSFRYYFFMKRKWKYFFVELQIVIKLIKRIFELYR